MTLPFLLLTFSRFSTTLADPLESIEDLPIVVFRFLVLENVRDLIGFELAVVAVAATFGDNGSEEVGIDSFEVFVELF